MMKITQWLFMASFLGLPIYALNNEQQRLIPLLDPHSGEIADKKQLDSFWQGPPDSRSMEECAANPEKNPWRFDCISFGRFGGQEIASYLKTSPSVKVVRLIFK